jgi:pyruvate dehydrogenase E2 component (dihydrolipoamide acetyltransferase)
MTMAASRPVLPERIRATPYARRLARERNLPLSAIAGSGPNGRITGDDLKSYQPLEATAPGSVAQMANAPARNVAAAPVPAVVPAPRSPASAAEHGAAALSGGTAPAAIVAGVEFTALGDLLVQIATLRSGVGREDLCLKAAAVALSSSTIAAGDDGILLLASPNRRQYLAGIEGASVGAIAALREAAHGAGSAGLAVSFVGRAGVRPVAAQLVDGVAARLVIGASQNDGTADCLLSYDPTRIDDEEAENFLVAFRDLVETPYRLLV